MDEDEYQRMVVAGEDHWWYRSTRTLLEEMVTPHLSTSSSDTLYLDAAGGSGATGSWLAGLAMNTRSPSETANATICWPSFPSTA